MRLFRAYLRARQLPLAPAATLMALVAVHTVVNVPVDVRVMEIGRVIVPVAPGALEHAVIVRVGMASRADAVGVPVVHREVRVIEGGS